MGLNIMSPTTEFPSALNELVRSHQTCLNYAAIHAYTLELTLPQLDIILTLGHAFGMTFKRLGEKTLITVLACGLGISVRVQ